jgi:H+-transporting ATPase
MPSILRRSDYDLLELYEQLSYIPFHPMTKRTEGTITDKLKDKTFKTSKGAQHIIMQLLPVDDPAKDKIEADVARLGESGIRTLAVAFTEPNLDI